MAKKWNWVPGYEGYYLVSSEGEVRRTKKLKPCEKFCKVTVLKQSKDTHGYYGVSLGKINRVSGEKPDTTRLVHHLVLLAFVGPCPPGMECRHLDNDKSNNKLENLVWGTKQENSKDRQANGRYLVTPQQVKAIRFQKERGESTRALAEAYGISMNYVWAIVRNLRWRLN